MWIRSAIVLLLGFFHEAAATVYYFSQQGDDSNSGTAPSEAWQTLEPLLTLQLQPGDSVLFERGSVFYGTIYLQHSGSAQQPIYFGAYGQGNLPVISGAVPLSGWTEFDGPIYQVSSAAVVRQLLLSEQRLPAARHPNSGFLRMEMATGDSAFFCSALQQADGYWNGATVRFRFSPRKWKWTKVQSFAGGWVILSEKQSEFLRPYSTFYLNDIFSALDTTGEWFYDADSQKLYFYASATDPNTMPLFASVHEYGLHIAPNVQHIVIQHLRFHGQAEGVFAEENYSVIDIDSCQFTVQLEYGIRGAGTGRDMAVTATSFRDIAGLGLSISNGRKPWVAHCSFRRIGMVAGLGARADNNMCAMEFVGCDSAHIHDNRVDSIGGIGLYAGLSFSSVERNILDYTSLWTNDLAAVYVYAATEQQVRFCSNFIFRSRGEVASDAWGEPNSSGIFVDGPASQHLFCHNTIAWCTHGIRLARGAHGCTFHFNTSYHCTQSQFLFEEVGGIGSTASHHLRYNVLVALHEDADVIRLVSALDSFLPMAGDSNYYVNPYAYPIAKSIGAPWGIAYPRYYTLARWQQFTGGDKSSKPAFLYRTRMRVQDTLSGNLIKNGHFTQNFDNWFNMSPSLMSMLLDNGTDLDYGCLKLMFKSPHVDSVGVIRPNLFVTDSGGFYRLRISSLASKPGALWARLKKSSPDFDFVASTKVIPLDAQRMDCEYVFQTTKGFEKTMLTLEMEGWDSLAWIDNVSLQKVDVVEQDPQKTFRFYFNSTNLPEVIDLGDSIFYNLDQQLVTGKWVLQPFQSVVLVFDSALIKSVRSFTASPYYRVWPNPARQGDQVTADLPCTLQKEITLSVINSLGMRILTRRLPITGGKVQFFLDLTPGYYLLLCEDCMVPCIGKLVVQ